jgi:hypothetical protein
VRHPLLCLTGLVVLRQHFEVDEHALRRFCNTYQGLKRVRENWCRRLKPSPFRAAANLFRQSPEHYTEPHQIWKSCERSLQYLYLQFAAAQRVGSRLPP